MGCSVFALWAMAKCPNSRRGRPRPRSESGQSHCFCEPTGEVARPTFAVSYVRLSFLPDRCLRDAPLKFPRMFADQERHVFGVFKAEVAVKLFFDPWERKHRLTQAVADST